MARVKVVKPFSIEAVSHDGKLVSYDIVDGNGKIQGSIFVGRGNVGMARRDALRAAHVICDALDAKASARSE
jgi:hypothetical protein